MKRFVASAVTLFGAAFCHADETVDITKPAAAAGLVEITMVTGSIEVTGWDRNDIQVAGTIGDDVEEVEFKADDSGDAEIHVRLPERKRDCDCDAHLRFSVPRGSSLEITAVAASITVKGVRGKRIKAETVSSGVQIEDAQGDVDATTVSGGVTVHGSPRDVEAGTVSGRIEVAGVQHSFDGETISGGIQIVAGQNGDGALAQVRAETISGSISYDGALTADGDLDAKTHNGRVTVTFSRDVPGKYELETFNGDITCEFGPEPTRKEKYGPGKTLSFTHGTGDADISIDAFNGSIVVRNK
jgi:DUF4097 and DUF4098 domain-containing protein YvlB